MTFKHPVFAINFWAFFDSLYPTTAGNTFLPIALFKISALLTALCTSGSSIVWMPREEKRELVSALEEFIVEKLEEEKKCA